MQTKGFTLEQMSAVFGDAVVDMQGNIEKAEDFMHERHSIEQVHEVLPRHIREQDHKSG